MIIAKIKIIRSVYCPFCRTDIRIGEGAVVPEDACYRLLEHYESGICQSISKQRLREQPFSIEERLMN